MTLTPAERPESQRVVARSGRRTSALSEWIRRVQPGAAGGVFQANPGLEFNVVRPGTALALQPEIAYPRNAPSELPESLSITVTREGKKPAKISIKQKERDIETTEDKLNELPDDLKRVRCSHARPAAERGAQLAYVSLSGSSVSRSAQPALPAVLPQPPQQPRPGIAPQPVAPPQPRQPREPGRAADPLTRGVESRILDLERRLEELQRPSAAMTQRKTKSKTLLAGRR